MSKKIIIAVLVITAAVSAAVVFNRIFAYTLLPAIFLPSYSEAVDKTSEDDRRGYRVVQNGRRIEVFREGKKIWKLPADVAAQDHLFEDIDHDGERELLILCWKRGRYGRHMPTWVRHDEIGYSQHIFIYETEEDIVRPKWMASDIGQPAAAIEFEDGQLLIYETDGDVARWRWTSWGLEKM